MIVKYNARRWFNENVNVKELEKEINSALENSNGYVLIHKIVDYTVSHFEIPFTALRYFKHDIGLKRVDNREMYTATREQTVSILFNFISELEYILNNELNINGRVFHAYIGNDFDIRENIGFGLLAISK